MLPTTLAVVDDDQAYCEFLATFLQDAGVQVHAYTDSNDLLADPRACEFGFYVLDLSLPGVDGVELIKILRRRTQAGIIVVSGRLAPDVFQQVVDIGADMYLAKPVQFEQVLAVIQAVQRRVPSSEQPVPVWRLDRRARDLIAPDGARVALSDADLVVMETFLAAQGEAVPRDALLQGLGRPANGEAGDGLNATIYRLRRRIEKATPAHVPLQSKARVGYVFKAPLLLAA